MTRHQRRKLARARKDAKASILNARAMQVLKDELRKRNLSQRIAAGSRALKSSAERYQLGYSTRGAGGKRLGVGDKVAGRKKVAKNVKFDASQYRDEYCIAGEAISVERAKRAYQGCIPNCERPDFKGPFVRKPKA